MNCMSNIMTSLTRHNGNIKLLEIAKPLVVKLSDNKVEVQQLKDDLKFHMGRVNGYIKKFNDPTETEIKEGETSNTICGIFMGVPELAQDGTDKNILKQMKDLWDLKNPISATLKKFNVAEQGKKIDDVKKLTGKKKEKHLGSIDSLVNSMQNIIDWSKGNDDVNSKIRDSKIVPSILRSWNSLSEYPDQVYKHAKLLNLLAKDKKTLDDLVVDVLKNDEVKMINYCLEKYQNNQDVMGEVIPLALLMCEKSPQIAKKIDTKALIPILLEEGRTLLMGVDENLAEDPEILEKLVKNLGILESFSKDRSNITVMDKFGGLAYYNDVKKRCALTRSE